MPPKKTSIGRYSREAWIQRKRRVAKRASETPEEREARLAAIRERMRELREQETEEQRQRRLERLAEKARKRNLEKKRRKEAEARKLEMQKQRERIKKLVAVKKDKQIMKKERERVALEQKFALEKMRLKSNILKNIKKNTDQKLFTSSTNLGFSHPPDHSSSNGVMDSLECMDFLDDVKIKDEPVVEPEEGEIVNGAVMLNGTECTLDERPDPEEVEIQEFLSTVESHIRLWATEERRVFQSSVMDLLYNYHKLLSNKR